MSELDDATARLEADVEAVKSALADLRQQVADLGTTGADVTRINAALDNLEAAVAPPA